MLVNIDENEWYPVLSISKGTRFYNDSSIEVSDEIVEEWDQLMIQFNKMQDKLDKILKENS